jgi:sortase B
MRYEGDEYDGGRREQRYRDGNDEQRERSYRDDYREQRYRERRTQKKQTGKRRVLILLIIVCAAVFAVSAYMLINYYWTGHQAEQAFEALRPPGDGDEPDAGPDAYALRQQHYLDLKKQNPDFVAWLKIFGTTVDYPVVQTPDEPEKYLHLDFKGAYSAAGTLFASSISDIDKPSDAIIIFGHNMKNGSMFGGLDEYTDKDYLRQHPIVRLDTLEEERFFRIFCVFTGRESDFRYYDASDFADEAAFYEFIAQAEARELYPSGESAEYGDELLLLSTCEYSHNNGRLVLLARRYDPFAVE